MPSNYPNDPYAPNFILLINDVPLSDDIMRFIPSAKFEHESDNISSIIFDVSYQVNAIGGISNTILYDKLFSPGNKVVIRGGYGDNIIDMGGGYIREIEPSFNENEAPTLKIICYDKLHNFTLYKSETGRSWPSNWRDSQIATYIGTEGGFLIDESESASLFGIRKTRNRDGEPPRIQKRGESNYDFLRSLADLNGFEMSCTYDPKVKKFRLFFEPHRDQSSPLITFEYGTAGDYQVTIDSLGAAKGTLLSFKPKFSITSQFTKYRAYSVDENGQEIAHTMTLGDFIDEEQESIKAGGLFVEELLKAKSARSSANVQQNVSGELIEVVSTKIFSSRKQANEYLKLHMRQLSRNYVTGTAEVKGNQLLQARQVHNLTGLGPFFDGKYYIRKATHDFSPDGFKTSIEVSKITSESRVPMEVKGLPDYDRLNQTGDLS